jgi:EpsI family protein
MSAAPASNAGLLITAVVAALVVSSGPALAYWERARAHDVNSAALQFPPRLSEYTVGKPTGQWQPKYGEPAARMAASLTVPQSFSPPVDAFVYYYLGSNKGHTLIESTNRLWDEHDWNAVARSQVSTHIGSTPVTVNELVLSAPYQHRLVWSVYWAGGKFTNSGMDVRLARLESMFSGGNGAALVAVSTPIEGVTLNGARNRLSHVLSAMNDLPLRLQQVKAHRQ